MSDYLATDVERLAVSCNDTITELRHMGFAAESVKLADIRLKLQELGRTLREKGQQ